MKRKSGFAKMFISMVLILSLFVSNIYAYTDIDGRVSLNDSMVYSGRIIPAGAVEAAFSDKIDYNSLDELRFKRTMSFAGDSVSVNLSLLVDSSVVQLEYEGKLYKSFRYTDEKPVYIGVFEDDSTVAKQNLGQTDALEDNFKIIYFEISNDSSPYNLNGDLRESASITMYLQSEEGVIYDLGSEIVSPLIFEGVNDQAPSDKDINWFLDFFKGTYEEENYSSRSTGSSIWAGSIHSLKYQIADYEHMFSASPYIDFSYGDVPDAGVVPFSMSLKLSESHRYRVVGATSWTVDTGDYDRYFNIDNVQLTWTAGGNTEITYVAPHLNTHEQGGGDFGFLGLTAAVTGVWPQTTAVSAILSAADAILSLDTGYSSPFTNTRMGGSLTNTYAYKIQFPADYYIERSGYGLSNPQAERFEYIAFMATTNSNLTRQYRTTAVADFTFRLSWRDITGQSGSKVYEDYKELEYYNNY